MKEYIQKLKALVARLEELETEGKLGELDLSSVHQYLFDKTTLASVIRLLGGKWTKNILCPDHEYASIQFTSDRYPLYLSISRDKVCKKTVSYDCEPIFAPGEDDQIVEGTK